MTDKTQNEIVFEIMSGGKWWTLEEIHLRAAFSHGRRISEAGISARLRDQRKCGHTVDRRIRKGNLHEYKLTPKRAQRELVF